MRKRDLARQQKLLDRAFIAETEKVEAYVAKWHATYDWAVSTVEGATGDAVSWPDASDRVEKIRGSIVRDLENEEEAYRKAVPIDEIMEWLSGPAPGRADAGRRRVVIRAYTWTIDDENEAAYDPEWIKLGEDMTPHAARAWAMRWMRDYQDALIEGTASREIRATALEILYWTQAESSRTV